MRLRCLAAACAAALLLAFGPAARADLLIKIDKSIQQMTVSADGEPLYIWPVSTGRHGYNTPSGQYTPFRMERDHFSEEWDDAPMPYSIFFTEQGHAIHGTYEARYLGRAVSHGCVRLSVRNAAILWDLVKEHGKANTKVVLIGEIPSATPAVAHATPKREDDVTGDLPPRKLRQAQHWREQRDGERYGYYARERPRYTREPPYRPRRYYDRYDGPPPPFPFFLFVPPDR
jgi:hypothetical protein